MSGSERLPLSRLPYAVERVLTGKKLEIPLSSELDGYTMTHDEMKSVPRLHELIELSDEILVSTHGQGGTGHGEHEPSRPNDPWWPFIETLLAQYKRWPVTTPSGHQAFEPTELVRGDDNFKQYLKLTNAGTNDSYTAETKMSLLDGLVELFTANYYDAEWHIYCPDDQSFEVKLILLNWRKATEEPTFAPEWPNRLRVG